MLDEHFECPSHAVRPEEVNSGEKLRRLGRERLQKLLGAQPDQETHLVGKSGHLSSVLFSLTIEPQLPVKRTLAIAFEVE